MNNILNLKIKLIKLFAIVFLLPYFGGFGGELYAQVSELYDNSWYLEKVIIDNESFHILDFTEYVGTITFNEIDEEVEVFLCEYDNFQSGIVFFSNNSFEIFDIFLNPFFGECIFIEGGFLFFQDAYFSVYLENFEFPKNPFTFTIETIDDYLQLTIENHEGDWAVYNSVLLSMSSFSQNSFALYPNPVNESVNVKNNSNQQVTATIYNIDGKWVQNHSLETNLSIIDVKELKAGLYFVVFESEVGERVSKKFVKQ